MHADRRRLHRGRRRSAAARAPASPSRRSIAGVRARGRRDGASDELVAALAGGEALSFEPDADEDELLPGDRVAPVAEAASRAAEATPEEIAAELAREAAEKAERQRLTRPRRA